MPRRSAFRSLQQRARFVAALLERDGRGCWYCGLELDDEATGAFELTVEHLLPRSAGGRTVLENLALVCAGCNRCRGNIPLDAFLASKRFAVRCTGLRGMAKGTEGIRFVREPRTLDELRLAG